nr:reverse transcriptase domain-containing protein [Tanacetum cinerariifolium]
MPEQYVLPPLQPPNMSLTDHLPTSLPLIDLSMINHPAHRSQVIDEVHAACKQLGFFQALYPSNFHLYITIPVSTKYVLGKPLVLSWRRTPRLDSGVRVKAHVCQRMSRDPGKFLIPCDFPGMAECLALADLGASINLMPFSVWKRLSLPDLTPTCMTLELADRSISHPVGVAENVYVKVGSFHFLADFIVVDFDADPRVPLILGRSFLKTGRALIDVFEEAITFNLDQTSRYSANYSDMTAKRIDFIDMAYVEYSQKVLGFSDTISSVSPTLYYDPIVSTTSSTLTPFRNNDFILEEDQEKTTFTCPYGTFACRRMPFGLCNAPGTFQRSFLGHAAFYHRFIKDFSKIARPMTGLLEKDTPFIFSQECVNEFQTLKRKLTEAPILIASDWDMPFELMCDVSDFAIGAVLGQRQDKHFRLIHYASKTMTEAESTTP